MALGYGNGLQQWEIAVAKKLVGEFRRRSRRLEREEFDDLLQECLAHWIEVRARLTAGPEGPPIAYMARVVRNKLTDMLREQGATKRGGDFDTVSLDAPVGDDDDGPTFADLIDVAKSGAAGEATIGDPSNARCTAARAPTGKEAVNLACDRTPAQSIAAAASTANGVPATDPSQFH